MKNRNVLFFLFFSFLITSMILSTTLSDKYSINQSAEIDYPIDYDPEAEYSMGYNLFIENRSDLALNKLQKLRSYLKNTNSIQNHNKSYVNANLILGILYYRKGIPVAARAFILEVLEYSPYFNFDEKIFGTDAKQFFFDIQTNLLAEKEFSINQKIYLPINQGQKDDSESNSLKTLRVDAAQDINKIQIMIIKEGAQLFLSPDESSAVLKNLPLGALLNVKEILDKWVKIELLPNKDGMVIVGYVHSSYVKLEKSN